MKVKPTVHEKTIKRVQQQADRHLDKFRRMELDLKEAVDDLNGVVRSIDAEMDKLAALRIQTQKTISSHEQSLQNISGLLGGVQ